ncbi:MAG: glycosyltransferase [Solirubrobacterales bacterium]|nr:glycosyltransferase [Solirubrobacterales bacterium]
MAGITVAITQLGSIPLSALREVLDDRLGSSHWTIGLEGIPGRALLQAADTQVTYPLTLDRPYTLSGHLQLIPNDWLKGSGSLNAQIEAQLQDGSHHTLHTSTLKAAAAGGPPDSLPFQTEVPANTTALSLTVHQAQIVDGGSVGRALWLEPTLTDPTASNHEAPAPPPVHTTPTTSGPLISVLTPVHDPPLPMLEECIDSVINQSYPNWELCLVDDGSKDPTIIERLETYAQEHPNITLQRNEAAGGISNATNKALNQASGEYIALLDHDDTLERTALEKIAATINHDPTLDMLYSDEAVLYENGRQDPIHKPGWSPDHFHGAMYTCHLGVYRRALALEVGGFDTSFDGCQDYDFVLRLIERTSQVTHIPEILYYWRAHAASTAGGEQAKPYAYVAQPEAISAHLARVSETPAEVQFGKHMGLHRIVYQPAAETSVSVVAVIDEPAQALELLDELNRQPHRSWELIIARPEGSSAAEFEPEAPNRERVRSVESAGPALQRLVDAAATAEAEHLLLLDAPGQGLTQNWLSRLLGYSVQSDLAAAGPVVLDQNGRIAHAGVAMPEGVPLHLLRGHNADAAPAAVFNVAALDSVLITSRSRYEDLGGLDTAHGDLALIDYCLRARASGGRIVLVPDVRVRVYGRPPSNDLVTLATINGHWSEAGGDPYYNPAFDPQRGDFRFDANAESDA